MSARLRDFHWERDFESVRGFLAGVFGTRKAYTNWIPSELENIKFGPGGTEYLDAEDEFLKVWEVFNETQKTAQGIIAVSYTKPPGKCWLSVHPHYMSAAREIVLWMQNRVKEMQGDGRGDVNMSFVADDNDAEFIRVLSDLGFQKGEVEGDIQIRSSDSLVPAYSLPEGYTIRNAVIEKDFVKYREVQMAVFSHIVSMNKELLELYSTASFYREDLDIVAVGPDSRFAAFCTARIDPLSKIAELEPVGTHPDHRRLGLAKAVICESLKRLEKYKPSIVVILGAAPTEGARRLYESVGFVNEGTRHYWIRTV
ncbi:GNAT family N-acetyltransferase [Candidatus Bathyarchaeota archaeon]|nr:GNAT family N-acetyltransferase [Candidatus Bathyarchaeota archaeon]NIV45238.1 GNAT family N-acetyltransferase [Candidatus Bathyarchaeota archaeon]